MQLLVPAVLALAACGGGAEASPASVTSPAPVPPVEAAPTPSSAPASPSTTRAPVTTTVTTIAPTVVELGTTATTAIAPELGTTPPLAPVPTVTTEPPLTLPPITLETVPAPLPTLPAAPPPPTTTAATAGGGTNGGGGGGGLGRIEIPKLGVSAGLQSGVALSVLDRGPGHWPGTALPGQPGNVVVAGHRTSHGGIFRYINTLAPGDQIIFDNGNGRFVYLVTGTQIVNPDAMWIIGQGGGSRATLFACHPPGSTAQRIVVFAKLSG